MGWVRSRISTFATVKWVLPALLLPSVRRSKRQLPALNLSFPPSQIFNVHSTVTLVRAADLDGSFLLAADSALTAAVNFLSNSGSSVNLNLANFSPMLGFSRNVSRAVPHRLPAALSLPEIFTRRRFVPFFKSEQLFVCKMCGAIEANVNKERKTLSLPGDKRTEVRLL